MSKVVLKLKRLVEGAIIPKYETEGSAGFDLSAVEAAVIAPGDIKLIKTGLAVEVPEGYELQVRSRSGLALKKGVAVLNSPGTVDSDYRNEVGVILINQGKEDFIVGVGDRIAQGVVAAVNQVGFLEVDELSETNRKGGFGSTGVKRKKYNPLEDPQQNKLFTNEELSEVKNATKEVKKQIKDKKAEYKDFGKSLENESVDVPATVTQKTLF